MSIVYTGGTFDLFHVGHVNLLGKCREVAGPTGKVVVSLNTDEFILKYKGRLPVYGYQDRKQILLACRYVDVVVQNIGNEDSRPAIDFVKPDYIVVGSDWVAKDYHKQMCFTQAWLDCSGISLVYVPYTKGVSTTEIRKKK